MSLIIAMCLYALSMSISPGPVNVIALSTGANYGFRKAMPYVSGATIGFTLVLILIGLGVAELVNRLPVVLNTLAIVGAAYIFYMGYKIAVSKPDVAMHSTSRPSFNVGFLLQWLNPKAWIASVSGVSAFVSSGSYVSLALFCGLYFCICYISIASWALAGDRVKNLLQNPQRLKLFNIALGCGLIAVATYLFAVQIMVPEY